MSHGEDGARMAAREIEREARRLLPRLERDAGMLRRPDGHGCGKYGLYTRRNGYRRPVAAVSATLVEKFTARGWLGRDGGGFRLTDAGSAWLRRADARADPFREQHQLRTMSERTFDDGTRRPVLVNDGESPLGWLRRRKDRNGAPMIGEPQFQAGERLRDDFWRARMRPRVTADWSAPASSRRTRRAAPETGLTGDAALAAKQRVIKALDATGPEFAGLLIDVCCHLQGLEEVEKAYGWPQRSGKVVLQIALTRLARHYGMISDADERRPARRLRSWGSGDYRPTLNAWR